MKERIDKLGFIKIKKFSFSKGAVQKIKSQAKATP